MTCKNYFIDTSALFKRYVEEKGSETVNNIFAQSTVKYISSICLVEVVSNLRRLVDVDYILNEEEFALVKGTFFDDIKRGTIDVIETTPPVILASLNICSETYVTPIDSIQLATVLESPEELIFVCSDTKLIKLAKQKGLDTLNPEE